MRKGEACREWTNLGGIASLTAFHFEAVKDDSPF
jgi:hypothetical protein